MLLAELSLAAFSAVTQTFGDQLPQFQPEEFVVTAVRAGLRLVGLPADRAAELTQRACERTAVPPRGSG